MSLMEVMIMTPHRTPSNIPLLNLPDRDDEYEIIDNVTHQNNGRICRIPFLLLPRNDGEEFDETKNTIAIIKMEKEMAYKEKEREREILIKAKQREIEIAEDKERKEENARTSVRVLSLKHPTPDPFTAVDENTPSNVPSFPENLPMIIPYDSAPLNNVNTLKNVQQNFTQNVPQNIPQPASQTPHTAHTALNDENAVEFYSGTKNFWRIGTVVDFKLINHKMYSVIELIMSVAAKKIEAPRFYLNSTLLYGKFPKQDIKERMNVKKSMLDAIPLSDSVAVMSESDLKESVLRDLAMEYIETRIHVPSEGNNHRRDYFHCFIPGPLSWVFFMCYPLIYIYHPHTFSNLLSSISSIRREFRVPVPPPDPRHPLP